MLLVHGSDQDVSNLAVSAKPLHVNSCGMSGRNSATSDVSFYVFRPRGRRDYQLLYLSQGTAEFFLQGAWRTLREGQAVLYRPDEPQRYLFKAQTPVLCRWVHFTGGQAEAALAQCGMGEGAVFRVGEDAEIVQLYDRMIRELQLKPPCYEAVAPALLYQLLGLMGRRLVILQDEGRYETRQRLMQIVEYMHYHYDEAQSIDQYAARCGMSRYHFAHAFTACVGESPYAYLTNLRMERAQELLLGSGMRVAEVARACGYENPLYFSRAFSRRFGLAPSTFQKKNTPV